MKEDDMKIRPGLTGLLNFLSLLYEEGLQYYLLPTSPTDLTVCFTLPGKRIEVRFEETEVDWSIFTGTEDCEKDFTDLIELIKNK